LPEAGSQRRTVAQALTLAAPGQDADLAEYAAERRPAEGDDAHAAHGRAWRAAFNALFGPLERHMATLLDVRAAGPVLSLRALSCGAAWVPPVPVRGCE